MKCQFTGAGQGEWVAGLTDLLLGHLVKSPGRSDPGFSHACGTFQVCCNPPTQRCNPNPQVARNVPLRDAIA